MKKESYKDFAERKAEKSPLFKDLVLAFLCGGAICVIGEGLKEIYLALGINEEMSGMLVSITLMLLAVILTTIGVFDKMAKVAGAGTLVPITGFANAMSSEAIDAHSEGWVLGVGAKLFSVAGPVIFYGTLASVIYGIIYYICTSFGG